MSWKIASLLVAAAFSVVVTPLPAQQRAAPIPPKKPEAKASDAKFNFTPTVGELVTDGYPATAIFFADGRARMQLNRPDGWKVAGSSGEMHFENPTFPGARITLRTSSLPPPEKFDDPWIESTTALIVANLPKDSKNQKVANVVADGFNIAGWKSMEIKMQYDQMGKRWVQDWVFLKLSDGRMLEVVFTSTDETFPTVRAATLQALTGWGVVLPTKPK